MNLSNNFTNEEVCKCKCGCGTYGKANMNLILALEKLRCKLNLPLIINSGYRCRKHKLEINKKSIGQHTLGTAVDIRVPKGITKKAFLIAILTVSEFKNGGIGVPISSNYIHVDIRPNRSRWGYDTNGTIISYDEGIKRI